MYDCAGWSHVHLGSRCDGVDCCMVGLCIRVLGVLFCFVAGRGSGCLLFRHWFNLGNQVWTLYPDLCLYKVHSGFGCGISVQNSARILDLARRCVIPPIDRLS